MELFEDFTPKPDSPLYLKINGHLKFFENNGLVHVFYGYLPLVRFNPTDWVEKRLAAVRLAEEFEIPYKYVAIICNMHRDTVSKLVKTKQLLGMRYLLDNNRGPKAPWKLVDNIIRKIDQLVKEQPDITNKKIVSALEEDSVDISETSVRRVRNRYQVSSLKDELTSPPCSLDQMARIAKRIEKYELPQQQMQIFQQELGSQIKDSDPFDYQAYHPLSASETAYLELLCTGQRSNYVGGLLYSPILSQFQFNEIIEATYEQFYDQRKTSYPLQAIFKALFYMLFFHFPSIESLKKARQQDYGILIGQKQLPTPKAIHRALNQLTRLNRSSKLMKEFACQFVKANLIEIGLLYFDEHFLPYYGIEHIAAGFFSQRRLAIGGNYQFWAHDASGHPFFVITTSARLKLREMIPHLIRRTQEITAQKRLIIVFDRGGYDIKLFIKINKYKTVIFITWAKYVSEKTLNQIPEKKYKKEITVTTDKEPVKYKLYSTPKIIIEGRTKKNKGRKLKRLKVHMIVLWRLSTNKKTALYTNDFKTSIEKLAEPMIQRWGAQENIFQKMMRRYNLNYHPGYYLEELINQPLVDNPKIKKLKKIINELELSIVKQKSNLATRLLKLKRTNISVEKYRQRQVKSLAKIEEKQNEADKLKHKLQSLSPKISILEVLADKKMSQFDLEKKKIYDVIQIVAYNSEQMLLDLFKKHYHNKRDIEQILDKIINHGGCLKLYNGKLFVLLDPIATPRYRRAAVGLCQEINRMKSKTNDRFHFPIFFRVRKQD